MTHVWFCLYCRQTGSPLHAATDTNVDDLNFTYLNENRIGNIVEMHRDALHKSDRAKLDMSLPLKRAAEKMDHCRVDLRSPARESPKHLKCDDARKRIKETAVLRHVAGLERLSHIQSHDCAPEEVTDTRNITKCASAVTPSSAASTLKVEAQNVDPQLHLLDFQLRNILKPSSRTEECLYPGVYCTEPVTNMGKDKSNNEGSNVDGGQNSRVKINDDALLSIMKRQCMDELLNNVVETDEERRTAHGSGPNTGWKAYGTDAADSTNAEAVNNRLCRPAEFVLRRHSTRDENDEGVLRDEKKEAKRLSLVDCTQLQHGHGSITFGNVEEISNANVQGEDPPTTNVYLDDHATRAAPYTLASQFVSLGFSDEEGGEDETESIRVDELKGAAAGRVVNASYMERGGRSLHLHKQLTEVGEKQTDRRTFQEIGWCGSLSQELNALDNNNRELIRFADSEKTDVSVIPRANSSEAPTPDTEHRPRKSMLEDTPRPKFNIRSPSSPARLSSSSFDRPSSGDRLHSVESGQRLSRDVKAEKENAVPSNVAPLAVQEDDEDSMSIGIEAQGIARQHRVSFASHGDRVYTEAESPKYRDDEEQCFTVKNVCITDNERQHPRPALALGTFREARQYNVVPEFCNTGLYEVPSCSRNIVYSDLDFVNKNTERCEQLDRLDNPSLSLSMPNVTVCQGKIRHGVPSDLIVNADAHSTRTENSESSNLSESRQHIIPNENSFSFKKSSDFKSVISDVHSRGDRRVCVVAQRLRDCRLIGSGLSSHQRSLSAGSCCRFHPDTGQVQLIGNEEILSSCLSSPERSCHPKPPTGSISRKSLMSGHARLADAAAI